MNWSKRVMGILVLIVFLGLLAGCSGGGGGGSGIKTAPPSPAAGSNWDQMVWDQGLWG